MHMALYYMMIKLILLAEEMHEILVPGLFNNNQML